MGTGSVCKSSRENTSNKRKERELWKLQNLGGPVLEIGRKQSQTGVEGNRQWAPNGIVFC